MDPMVTRIIGIFLLVWVLPLCSRAQSSEGMLPNVRFSINPLHAAEGFVLGKISIPSEISDNYS